MSIITSIKYMYIYLFIHQLMNGQILVQSPYSLLTTLLSISVYNVIGFNYKSKPAVFIIGNFPMNHKVTIITGACYIYYIH